MKLGRNRWVSVIGLTGGLGSGKTTVLGMFRKRGAFTLDADQIVHRALKNRRILKMIKNKFGPKVFKAGNILDRRKLAIEVFSSGPDRKWLEKKLHPLVRKEMAESLSHRRGKLAVCDVPLLFESGWNREFDRVVVVNAPLSKRISRLKKKGFTKEEAVSRMRAQWPLSKKVKRADFVVHNSNGLMNTRIQVHRILEKLLKQSS